MHTQTAHSNNPTSTLSGWLNGWPASSHRLYSRIALYNRTCQYYCNITHIYTILFNKCCVYAGKYMHYVDINSLSRMAFDISHIISQMFMSNAMRSLPLSLSSSLCLCVCVWCQVCAHVSLYVHYLFGKSATRIMIIIAFWNYNIYWTSPITEKKPAKTREEMIVNHTREWTRAPR